MFGKTRRAGLVLLLSMLMVYLTALTGGQASARQIPSTPNVVGHIASSGSQARANAAMTYWTPERMKNARSGDELLKYGRLTHKAVVKGPSGSGKPAAPTTAQKPAVSNVSPNLNAFQLPQVDYSLFPYSTIGKVFFHDSLNGGDFVCSGTAVNSNNKNVVDTAGHCVVQGGSGGNWYTNWIFCPQYFFGSTPFGCWSERQAWSWTTWINNGSLEDDFGDVVVWPNANGSLVNVVGGTGWAFGFATNQFFFPFGYPQAAPFDGNTIWYCAGTGAGSGFDDGTVVSVACDMTGGSSGGGWFISVNNAFGYVNGHNDFKFNNDPSHMYSPYYDSDWFGVFNSAQNV